MDEIVNQVAQRTGLPPDKARIAVESVLEFLKGRLPAALGSHLDAVVGGSAPAAGGTGSESAIGNLAGELGGLFGGHK